MITETPPIFGVISGPEGIPGDAPVTITADITPDPERTITAVVLNYTLGGRREARRR